MNDNERPRVLLASTSPYRAELLARLGIRFDQASPICDETALPGESPADLVVRLARVKAESLHGENSSGITIGSDQVAEFNGEAIGKPGDHATALAQLQSLSGQRVVFHTGLCTMHLTEARSSRITTEVQFRHLSTAQIERYLHNDRPYNCACSFKSESMGSVLVERMTSDDPSALIGLPLLQLVDDFSQYGFELPGCSD